MGSIIKETAEVAVSSVRKGSLPRSLAIANALRSPAFASRAHPHQHAW